jgi:hypothetical protein
MTMTLALATSTPTSMTVVATRTSISPRLKRRHGDFLVVGAEAAVEQAEAQAGERACAELVVHLGGGAELGFFREEFFAAWPFCSARRSDLRGRFAVGCCRA